MTVTDTVNKHLAAYPSLYLCPTWEQSRFAVLHHMFIVLGNGIKWAHTKDPKKGGYLTDPISYKRHSEWVRRLDRPYGQEKCVIDPRFFTEKVYEIKTVDREASRLIGAWGKRDYNEDRPLTFESDLKMTDKMVFEQRRLLKRHIKVVCPIEVNDKRNAHPYPNFSREYSCFWRIDAPLIQDDWRQAGIDHLLHWQAYFNDPERVKGYSYYPKPDDHHQSYKTCIEQQYGQKPEVSAPNSRDRANDITAIFNGYMPPSIVEKDTWIDKVRKDYEYPAFDGTNYQQMAADMWAAHLTECRQFIADTIARLDDGWINRQLND